MVVLGQQIGLFSGFSKDSQVQCVSYESCLPPTISLSCLSSQIIVLGMQSSVSQPRVHEVEFTDRHLCGSRMGIKGTHTHCPFHPFLRSGLLLCLQRACPQSSTSEHAFSSELAGLSLRGPSPNCMNTLLKVRSATLACSALPGFYLAEGCVAPGS